jgi:hypothetical protein
MIKIQQQFWKWYDHIKEPWRMLFAVFVLMSPLWGGIEYCSRNNIDTSYGMAIGYMIMFPILLSKILTKYSKCTDKN